MLTVIFYCTDFLTVTFSDIEHFLTFLTVQLFWTMNIFWQYKFFCKDYLWQYNFMNNDHFFTVPNVHQVHIGTYTQNCVFGTVHKIVLS
jgi:ABC-type polysaccharide/polyol phosphate export permease